MDKEDWDNLKGKVLHIRIYDVNCNKNKIGQNDEEVLDVNFEILELGIYSDTTVLAE